MFQLLDTKREISAAFQQMRATLKGGATLFKKHKVGWPAGSDNLDVCWDQRLRFWCHFDARRTANRYWCIFGIDDPEKTQMLSITVEINPPYSGVNNRTAGAFVRGPDGHIYLAHSGKIGGGKKGVGKSAFLNFCRGANLQTVRSRDAAQTQKIILGRIDGTQLNAEVAQFAREVARFKASIAAGETIAPSTETKTGFSPEFSGKRNSYPLGGEVEAECLHGAIVNSLAGLLSLRKFEIDNDQPRDLFIKSNGVISTLFEVKTNLSTTSIYGGIGQLMLHTALEKTTPRRILVLPGEPEEDIADALKELGIELLQYTWKNDEAKFLNIEKALGNRTN